MFSSTQLFVPLQACEQLLEMRVAAKLRGNKVDDFLNRLHVAVPAKRDNKVGLSQLCHSFALLKYIILYYSKYYIYLFYVYVGNTFCFCG